MSGFTPKVPLHVSSKDGFYALTQNLRQNTKQSLKMIVLTAPGERIMNPLFGVGLRNYLFENFTKPTASCCPTIKYDNEATSKFA